MLSKPGHLAALLFPRQAPRTFSPRTKNVNKPVLLLTIAVAAFLPLGTQAQKTDSAKVADNGKPLIADRDNKICLVGDAETLSGFEGRQVKVKALVGAARRQIRIMSVSAIGEEQAGTRLHDAAFRG